MMAQRIQTVCDAHLARGEDIEALTWQVLVRKAGSRVQTREVDLCDECSQALDAVAAFAAEFGRTDSAPGPRAVGLVAEGDGPGKRVTCPVDGCGVVSQRRNLSRHVSNAHGVTLSELADGAKVKGGGAYACPDCARTFARPQSMGAHRYQAHGYESPTRAARAAAAERAAS